MSTVVTADPRHAWFRDARFGMFIHWGLYSVLGRHEWARNNERIPAEEYVALADRWHPEPGAPRIWARMAREAGMRYLVLTTKHHDGFCLFGSKICAFNAVATAPGRDLVAEFVAACRAEGLRVGLYYSLMDWHHPDGVRCATDGAARQRFVTYTHGLVRELMTNYGKIDLLWYDIPWPLTAAGWETPALNAMVRRLQPGIVINDRSGMPQDFATPEQKIEPAADGRMWEACMTFAEESWGYTPLDTRYKTAGDVLRMLRTVACGHGNLLLNINPYADGSVPMAIRRPLEEIGAWLRQHGETIYVATTPMVRDHSLYGSFTCAGHTAYFHIDRWPGERLVLGGFYPGVKRATILGGGDVTVQQVGDRLALSGLPELPPNPLATVIVLECEGAPWYTHGPAPQILDRDDPWRLHTPEGLTPVFPCPPSKA